MARDASSKVAGNHNETCRLSTRIIAAEKRRVQFAGEDLDESKFKQPHAEVEVHEDAGPEVE
eukprot:12406484-Karenia_brevis.AAC.1